MQKNPGGNRFSSGARRAGGPAAPDRRYKPYFYILQAPAEYENDLGISGCGGNSTIKRTMQEPELPSD
jgi:hypothetical protein